MVIPISLSNEATCNYDIIIDTLSELTYERKVAIVTNPTISALHLEKLLSKIKANEIKVITIPDGEEYKTMQTVEDILGELFEFKFDRKSLLIAFGGGVIGDMTGFTASLYQRGVDFIQIPTTLLAQVDASVGGKTGVNNKYGKNLIGAFYQPKAVYIDPSFLSTLPKREFGAGVAEMIKMAVTFDSDFFEFLEKSDLSDEKILSEAIAKSVTIKASVVNQDEKEQGIRAALNYGHTFGHVIENETKYKQYLHGEAVAIGMVMANRLAVKLGFMELNDEKRVLELLGKYNLPASYEISDVESFYEHFFLDKKSFNSKIKFILPVGIGKHVMLSNIEKSIVIDVLQEFGIKR